MARAVAMERARVVALARRRILHHVHRLGCPRQGGKQGGGARRVVVDVIIVGNADGGLDRQMPS
jgi:hypothetical protein